MALVSAGYPGSYEKGKTIRGLTASANTLIFHAGTRLDKGNIVTEGGRVLAITGKGNSLEQARKLAYDTVSAIDWDGLYFRKDIGTDLLNYKGF